MTPPARTVGARDAGWPGQERRGQAGGAGAGGGPRLEIWGVLNATPDSFSDGGRFDDPGRAIEHGLRLLAEGADVLDVGGESTRPGAREVPPGEEIERVVPVLHGLRTAGVRVPISVDTRKAAVAAAALDAGADIVNDTTAGTFDPAMLPLLASRDARWVAMHSRGTPETMRERTVYGDVVGEVLAWLLARARAAEEAGLAAERITIDPGLGFAKTAEQSAELLRGLERFVATGRPVLVGASRKSFLGAIVGRPVEERLAASLAAVVRAREAGAAAVRVHDVAATRDLLLVLDAVGRHVAADPPAGTELPGGRDPVGR